MAYKIKKMIEEIRDTYGMDYKLDTCVFDDTRFDRMPGSMNPKTGSMCEFFSTNVGLYTFQLLMGCDNVENINWTKYERDCQKAYILGTKAPKCLPELYYKEKNLNKDKNKKKLIAKRREAEDKNYYTLESFKPVAAKRVKNILALGASGYGFYKCRERTCFIFRQMCRQAGYNEDDEMMLLHKLNSYFYQPLNEYQLIKQTDSPRSDYKMRNETLAMELHIEEGSPEHELLFKGFACQKLKKYGLTERQLTIAERYITISKMKLENPSVTLSQIKDATGYTIDVVKRINAQLNKDHTRIENWANTDYTNPDHTKFILDYFTKYPLFGRSRRKNKTAESSDSEVSDKEKEKWFKDVVIPVPAEYEDITVFSKYEDIIIPKETFIIPDVFLLSQSSKLLLAKISLNQWKNHKVTKKECRNKVRKIVKQQFRGECNAYVIKAYQSGSSITGLINYFKSFDLEGYKARKLALGYIRYNEEYVRTLNSKYVESIEDIEEIPEPHIEEMFKIEEFPQFKDYIPYNPLKYRPDVICKYYFGMGIGKTKEVIPEIYNSLYIKYHKLKDSYDYQKQIYKRYIKVHHADMCNDAVRRASGIIEEISNLIDNCYSELESLRLISFDVEEINRAVAKTLMSFADK